MAAYRKTPIRPLETERLILRPQSLADAPQVQELFPHWEVVKYLAATVPWPYPPTGAEDFLKTILPKIERQEHYHWVLIPKGKEHLIGAIGLTPNSDEDHRGFWLAQAYWGKGFMSEAVAAVTDFAFDELEMEYLLLNNAAANQGSHKLKERSGAEIIGYDEVEYVSGTAKGVKWKLTKERWAQHRPNFRRQDPPS